MPQGASSQVQAKQLVIGSEGYEKTSPFLFLSEDWFGPPGGFETHPHRGMQTVTIVLEGTLEHKDHTGAHGLLNAGDVQWMTAGRGVLHSEMPQGNVHTLQLWLNLPAKMKMIPARYQDQRLKDVPANGPVRVYAGKSGKVERPHGSDYPMWLLEIRGSVEQEIPATYRGFVYMLEGSAEVGGKALDKGDVGWFEPGEGRLSFAAKDRFRALLFAGEPIDEPVVAYGPFVMNTREQIVQAFEDYQAGRLVA
ncbi:MAG: quercetin 2,3-dioxygenase [Betaproteobacteria bacterium]|jgi:redox-sensitive bicupin YhaK (pirin superfamily)|nr:quercetin 2,3-dioxygenase [Betaproteobacteria bacterium]